MEDIKQLIKVAGPKMVPFIKSVTIYFLLVSFEHRGMIWATILKCAPIICLMIFVALYGIKLTKEYSYAHKIILGLIFSCAGDALLNFNLFLYGMAMFSIAQIFYTSALGFKPLRLMIGIPLYLAGAMFISLIFKNLDDVVKIGLPIYAALLITMCWRAISRVDNFKDYSNITNIACALGSVFFVASDALIGIDRFYAPIPHSTVWIMTTYYAAQFGITLSIVNVKIEPKENINNAIEKNTINNVKTSTTTTAPTTSVSKINNARLRRTEQLNTPY